ncbi:hypothetical protein A3K73_08280 [Candidatus Pacearchaeota archaeon RBG_13_36_9]|nr:MAG: hypothetical protein A3K73_08280 [Candidatus Pacearchaeota archaeon RBG_13_36_9]
MWIAKIKGFDKDNIYGAKAIKNKISIHYYPISHYFENNKYFFIAVGIVEGSEKNVQAFFKDLKRDNNPSKNNRWVVNLETEGNFFVCITAHQKSIELSRYVHLFYNPKFIHIDPAIINVNGEEEWNVASSQRRDIEKLIDIGEKKYHLKLLGLKETKMKNIGILTLLPMLTEKQKKAYLLAVENDYYDYPRKIELKKLSRLMKISLSTYQAHLRKAERQLLPFIARKYF